MVESGKQFEQKGHVDDGLWVRVGRYGWAREYWSIDRKGATDAEERAP
jgi:hypothetical protein